MREIEQIVAPFDLAPHTEILVNCTEHTANNFEAEIHLFHGVEYSG